MIRKEIDIHLEALAGYINDEDKLVTYKWLSKELGIHVNLSKQILFEYWDSRRKERKDSVTATFLIMGYLEDGVMRVEVVKEADLPSAKKNMSKIISEHIYSLQRSLPEIELLAISDKGDLQQSGVRCVESVMRSDHEMEMLRWGSSLANHKSPKIIEKNSTSKIQNQKQTNSETTKANEQTNNLGKESTAKSTAAKPADNTKKSAFNNMFAKAIDKKNKDKVSGSGTSDNHKRKGTAAKNSPPKPNAWFEAAKKCKTGNEQPVGNSKDSLKSVDNDKTSKTSDNVESKPSRVEDDADVSPPKKNAWFEAKNKPKMGKEKVENSDDCVESPIEDKEKEKSPENRKSSGKESSEKNSIYGKTEIKKKTTGSSSRGKKRQSSAKNESISKKRKRIIVEESSEDSSGSEMEDIREPDSPEKPQVVEKIRSCPSPPLVKCEGGRRKVRKLVDKTFMDEDGYFVTQKEYVYESCSDKEEEEKEEKGKEKVPVDVNKPSTSEPVVKTTNKRKQATLLNFFKKS